MARHNRKPRESFEMFGLEVTRWDYRNEFGLSCPVCSTEFNEVFLKDGSRYLACPGCGAISKHLVMPGSSAGAQGASVSITFPAGKKATPSEGGELQKFLHERYTRP